MTKSRQMANREFRRTGNLLGAAAMALTQTVDQSMASVEERSHVANAALAVLQQWPPQSIGGLSKILRRSHSATVRLVDELLAEGFVTKHPGIDRRSMIVGLTGPGRREAIGILAARERALGKAVAGLTAAEQARLSRILERILAALASNREACDHICRLCSLSACPQERCPAELAVLGRVQSERRRRIPGAIR